MVLFPEEWVYTLAVWHRGKSTKHSWAYEVLLLLGLSSFEVERQTFLQSNSRIRVYFKAYKSSPKGAVSVSWQQAWRLKSPVLNLAIVDTLSHSRAFYWTVTYFLFHRFLPHWVHWREEQAVSVLIFPASLSVNLWSFALFTANCSDPAPSAENISFSNPTVRWEGRIVLLLLIRTWRAVKLQT